MPKYKPMLVHFDEEGYKRAARWAMEKVVNFNDAKKFAEKHIEIKDTRAFADSFTRYFKAEFISKNREKIQLDISVEKLLDLMEIDLMPIAYLENKFNSNESLLSFDSPDGIPAPIIDKSQFEIYTNSSHQNAVLRDARGLIEAIQKVQKHTTVYPANIISGTSNLIGYDIRKQLYYIDPSILRNYGKD